MQILLVFGLTLYSFCHLVFLFKGLSFNTHELISNRISFYLIRGFEAKNYNNIIFSQNSLVQLTISLG